MKILITTFTYPPNADGCAEAASVLANGMARRGHQVTVATEFHPARKPETPGANPRVEQFKVSGTAHWKAGIRGDMEAYRNFLRKFDGDIAVFENWEVWSTQAALPVFRDIRARKVLVSHGYTLHIWDKQPRFPWGLGNWLGGWPFVMKTPFMMRKFDHLVFLSHRAKLRDRFFDHWLARRTGLRNYSIIPNGAWAREFAPGAADFRAEFNLGAGPLLLYVANYCDRKNQLMLVRAFRRAQLEGATLIMIGSEFNDYSEQVRLCDEELKRTHPAGRLVMLEKLNRAQTCAAYRAADLFVLSAKAETQPIVLLEAMASRTPFLATDVGCVAELPGGIVAKSEDEFAEKMRALITTPAWREKLAAEGWAACESTYDWERVLAAYENLFFRLAENKHPEGHGD